MGEKIITMKQVYGQPLEYIMCEDPSGNFIQIKCSCQEEKNGILAMIPSKIMSPRDFQQKFMNSQTSKFVYQEFIEGTFVCLFYDERICGWELATKRSIGCNNWYIRNEYNVGTFAPQLTFRQMFVESLGEPFDKDLNEISFLKELPKPCCYHFVIQHPSNKMVLNIQNPKVYLVDVYEITHESFIHIERSDYMEWPSLKSITHIHYPDTYDLTLSDVYDNLFMNEHFETYNGQGLMIVEKATGIQTLIEDSEYANCKELRGNHPNLQYLYLSLLQQRKLSQFLNVFTEYKDLFGDFFEELKQYVHILHQSYVSYYVLKKNETISKKYFPLVYKLHHEVYLVEKEKDASFIMKRGLVNKFVRSLEIGTLMYYLNYEEKQKPKEETSPEPEKM